MSNDPWEYRTSGMKCFSCTWFVIKVASVDTEQSLETKPFGRCRRHSPTMNGYPAVFGSDWCGDHKLDETKIGS